LTLGVDVTPHSTTKYLGGNSDVQEGPSSFTVSNEWYARILQIRSLLGAVAAPFGSGLVH